MATQHFYEQPAPPDGDALLRAYDQCRDALIWENTQEIVASIRVIHSAYDRPLTAQVVTSGNAYVRQVIDYDTPKEAIKQRNYTFRKLVQAYVYSGLELSDERLLAIECAYPLMDPGRSLLETIRPGNCFLKDTLGARTKPERERLRTLGLAAMERLDLLPKRPVLRHFYERYIVPGF